MAVKTPDLSGFQAKKDIDIIRILSGTSPIPHLGLRRVEEELGEKEKEIEALKHAQVRFYLFAY